MLVINNAIKCNLTRLLSINLISLRCSTTVNRLYLMNVNTTAVNNVIVFYQSKWKTQAASKKQTHPPLPAGRRLMLLRRVGRSEGAPPIRCSGRSGRECVTLSRSTRQEQHNRQQARRQHKQQKQPTNHTGTKMCCCLYQQSTLSIPSLYTGAVHT